MFDEFFFRLPLEIMQKMVFTYQSPIHHAEGSIYNHSYMVAELLPQEVDFQISALFHDLGKIDCTTFEESDKYGIKIQSIGHENLCKAYIDRFKPLYSSYEVNWNKVEQICTQHMRAHLYLDGKMSNPKKRLSFESLEYFKDIILFAEADNKGRSKENGRPILIITVGIPGSGKTTWRNSFVEKHSDYVVINPDDIRKEITGNISDQSQNRKVWKLAYKRLDESLVSRKNVIFDSTACSKKTIEEILFQSFQKAIPCFKVFYVDVETAYNRIQKDMENKVDRSNVPYDVVVNMKRKFDEFLPYLKESGGVIK